LVLILDSIFHPQEHNNTVVPTPTLVARKILVRTETEHPRDPQRHPEFKLLQKVTEENVEQVRHDLREQLGRYSDAELSTRGLVVDMSSVAWTQPFLARVFSGRFLEKVLKFGTILMAHSTIDSRIPEVAGPTVAHIANMFSTAVKLHTVYLHDNALGDINVFRELTPLLQHPNVKCLVMNNCGMSSACIKVLCSCLWNHTSLQSLSLSKNLLGNDDDDHFGALLSTLTGLIRLDLSGCRFDNNGTAAMFLGLEEANVASQFRTLNVAENEIGDEGDARDGACQFLKKANKMERFMAGDCGLGSAGIVAVLEALWSNPSVKLQYLDLSGNGKVGKILAATLSTLSATEHATKYSLTTLILEAYEFGNDYGDYGDVDGGDDGDDDVYGDGGDNDGGDDDGGDDDGGDGGGDDNNINDNDNDVAVVMQVLKRIFPNLLTLSLTANAIGKEGAKALLQPDCFISSLQTLTLLDNDNMPANAVPELKLWYEVVEVDGDLSDDLTWQDAVEPVEAAAAVPEPDEASFGDETVEENGALRCVALRCVTLS
jgi:Ran GTPase-activating protein (RanGAP) involved in mRNA processing and transport